MLDAYVIEREQLQGLVDALAVEGYQVIGPAMERGAIVYAPVTRVEELPAGYIDEQAGGHYRLRKDSAGEGGERALFRYAVGPHSWKRLLFPARQLLWRAERDSDSFRIEAAQDAAAKYAFLGVRGCELAAIRIQDRVFDNGDYADRGYNAKREQAFLVAVNCTRAGGTCFCSSMGSGPQSDGGYDLVLTELLKGDAHRFLVRAGTARGREILGRVEHQEARVEDIEAADRAVAQAAASMEYPMPDDAGAILKRNPEHPRWQTVAERCLTCANCTMVCPTCFCSTVEDTTSLDGNQAERWRSWDSCFTVDFSFVHGGSIRQQGAARYRQWITHKLAYWQDQFDSSGCTGCGRCITWCPVGIDIREEVAAIQASERMQSGGE